MFVLVMYHGFRCVRHPESVAGVSDEKPMIGEKGTVWRHEVMGWPAHIPVHTSRPNKELCHRRCPGRHSPDSEPPTNRPKVPTTKCRLSSVHAKFAPVGYEPRPRSPPNILRGKRAAIVRVRPV
jgi:hypothetical protein